MKEEQIKSPENGNTESINTFSNFKSIIKRSHNEKPIKFWFYCFLTTVCFIAFICTLFEIYFIPSPFSKKITGAINYSIRLFSSSFLSVEIIYLFLLYCSKKTKLLKITLWIIIGGLVIFSIVSFYIGIKGILELQSIITSEFFSYLAAISAFLAVVVAFVGQNKADKRAEKAEERLQNQEKESMNRYRDDSEKTIFFQLLELHTKKTESVIYEDEQKKATGYNAFKLYVEKVNDYFILHLLTNSLFENTVNKGLPDKEAKDRALKYEKDIDGRYPNAYLEIKHIHGLYDIFNLRKKIIMNRYEYKIEGRDSIREIYNPEIIEKTTGNEILNWVNDEIIKLINFREQPTKKTENYIQIAELLKYVYDVIYREDGHILGHYFRNLYYVLDTIDKFNCNDSQKEYYAQIFRAQLSRYELALAVCNAVGSHSSERVVELLNKYQILNGYYYDDLVFTKIRNKSGFMDENIRINDRQIFISDLLISYWNVSSQT